MEDISNGQKGITVPDNNTNKNAKRPDGKDIIATSEYFRKLL